MRRTKEHTTVTPGRKERATNRRFAGGAILMALSSLFLVTTWPTYFIENGEVDSLTHNALLGMDLPVNYYCVESLLFLAAVVSAVLYFYNMDDESLPSLVSSPIHILFPTSLIACIVGALVMPLVVGMSAGMNKADTVLTEYAKEYKSSPSMYVAEHRQTSKLDKVINEVKADKDKKSKETNDEFIDTEFDEFIDTTFNEKDGSFDSYYYVYKVIYKNEKMHLIGVSRKSDNIKDVLDIGEITKSQTRELADITEEIHS